MVSLDDFLADVAAVGLIEIDVEGHEDQVLRGAARLRGAGHVRAVIVEEYEPYPAPSRRLLEGHGFTLFRLSGTHRHPVLLPPGAPDPNTSHAMPDYLATRTPDRVHVRYAAHGWRAMSPLAA